MTCRACIVRRQLLHGLDFRVCLSCTFFPLLFSASLVHPSFFFLRLCAADGARSKSGTQPKWKRWGTTS